MTNFAPRHVDALVRALFAALLDADTLPGGFRALDWDAEQGPSLLLEGGGRRLLIELGPRDEAHDCYARTRRFNVYTRDPLAPRRDFDAADRAALDTVVHSLRERERNLPMVERTSPTSAKCQVRHIAVSRALVREGEGQYYLNPYVGCTIGCSFCFVGDQADLSRALEGAPKLPWGRYVDVKANLPEVLAREVRELAPGVVRMSPIVTDPYQPIERRERLTRRCLELLLDAGFSPCILTRAARVTEDLPLLARFRRALLGFSVPTDDDRVRRLFEPGADSIQARVEALRAARAAGLFTFAVVQPMLPMTPERLVALLAPLVSVVRVDRLHRAELVRETYERAGLSHALGDDYFEQTRRELVSRFEAAGVRIHELDELTKLGS